MAATLTHSQCILLTVHYASEGNIKALHSFTPTRSDVLEPDLILRILLTYLPETLEPREYTTYVEEVASRLYLDITREEVEIDVSPVKDIDDDVAKKKVRKIVKGLYELNPPSFPPEAPDDLLTRFLCHRAYKIDAETGLLNLVPELVEPFLNRNGFIRTWYISVVLPLLRLGFEYYPEDDEGGVGVGMSLKEWAEVEGRRGIEILMGRCARKGGKGEGEGNVARDIKGLVGPWTYGHTERKRRKVHHHNHHSGSSYENSNDDAALANMTRKISLSGVSSEDKTGHDWEYMYRWLVLQSHSPSSSNFPLVVRAVEDWDGPGDVDLGGFAPGNINHYLDEELQGKLEAQYAQAAFAACYAVEADTEETVHGAHAILARLAELLDFVPPPDLATSVDALPKIEAHALRLDQSQSVKDLAPDALLRPEHPLTTPRLETYMLLQMIVYSAYQFAGLGYPISLVNVAKLHFYADGEEQLGVLKKILRGLGAGGARRDEGAWSAERAKLMWLWNWGIDVPEDSDGNSGDGGEGAGAGVLGKVKREAFEREMLGCFVETSLEDVDPVQNTDALAGLEEKDLSFPFASPDADGDAVKSSPRPLPLDKVEKIVLAKAMEAYDGASNGNRNRGGMKKANDIISAFKPHFANSAHFREATALIAATHSLSFYSLTLQHGVPFQPVSIRVSQDPLGLVGKVLEQNPGAYTQLDDLVGIGRNLVGSGLVKSERDEDEETTGGGADLEEEKKEAERRVTFMAIEAALRENDFETAYSYIINRLTPSTDTSSNTAKTRTDSADDTSWRAAFLAGRYRPSSSTGPSLRRLEQRTELLSLALLLAPKPALTEILAAWRRCEEETAALQREQVEEEEAFDDFADGRGNALPGNFTVQGEQPALLMNQKRREMGRMGTGPSAGGGAGVAKGGEEAPVSMFDLTRSAAQALSRGAFPLRAASTANSTSSAGPGRERSFSGYGEGMDESVGSLNSDGGAGGERVRKRDMVANAASGALASGLGWVLGATPAGGQQQQQ